MTENVANAFPSLGHWGFSCVEFVPLLSEGLLRRIPAHWQDSWKAEFWISPASTEGLEGRGRAIFGFQDYRHG